MERYKPRAKLNGHALDAELKQTAGILFVAPDGEVLLLRRGSQEENYAGHWALPGGNAEEGETPEQAADREAREEIGGKPGGEKQLLDKTTTPTGMVFHTFLQPMVFHTFLQPVESKFVPKLNGEHSGYCWSAPDQLPQPLHPAVAKTIQTRLEQVPAGDMSDEDWDGLEAGLAKWLGEEREEDEHAEDEEVANVGHPPPSPNPKAKPTGTEGEEDADSDGAMDAKLSHDEVAYGPGKQRSHCSICEYYEDSHCQLVVDPIEPQGWCKLFTKEQKYAVEVVRIYDGPWVSCMSKDGERMYVNSNLPASVEIKGVDVDVDEDLIHHEVPELEEVQKLLAAFEEEHGRKPKTEEKKQIYLKAHHGAGTPSERQYCKERGIDWDGLQAWFRGEESRIENLKVKRPPPDADVRPIPHKHGDLEIALDAGTSNVYNAGISHLGRKGPGTDPACGNPRAHITLSREQFSALPSGERCKRCNEKLAIWDKIKAKREGAHDSKQEPEHTLEIQYDGDFDMAGLIRMFHLMGGHGSSRGVKIDDDEDYEFSSTWDGDGADKIHSAIIDGVDILKDGAEDAQPRFEVKRGANNGWMVYDNKTRAPAIIKGEKQDGMRGMDAHNVAKELNEYGADAEFKESDHPRKGGKFAKKGEGGSGAKQEEHKEKPAEAESAPGGAEKSGSHAQKVKAFFKQPDAHKVIAKEAGAFLKEHAAGAAEHHTMGAYFGMVHTAVGFGIEHLGASVPEALAVSVVGYALTHIATKLGVGPEQVHHMLIKVGKSLLTTLLGVHEVGKMKAAHVGEEEGDSALDAEPDDEIVASIKRFVEILEKTPTKKLLASGKTSPKNEKSAQDEALWLALDRSIRASDDKYAFDRVSVREYDADGRLHITVANISKSNVCPYLGHEIPDEDGTLRLDPDKVYQLLRPAEELEKAAATFNGIPVLREHIPVSADDHQPDDVIGATGTDAEFVDPYLRNSLVIWVKDDIDDIKSGERRELSCAYRYVPIMEPGEYKGVKFDGRMSAICGNHIALIREGRAGADVRIGDKVPEALRWAAIEEAILQCQS